MKDKSEKAIKFAVIATAAIVANVLWSMFDSSALRAPASAAALTSTVLLLLMSAKGKCEEHPWVTLFLIVATASSSAIVIGAVLERL